MIFKHCGALLVIDDTVKKTVISPYILSIWMGPCVCVEFYVTPTIIIYLASTTHRDGGILS